MSKMKKLQPRDGGDQEASFPDDPAKQQQETMALYQREKINPAGGLPARAGPDPDLLALYKVLSSRWRCATRPSSAGSATSRRPIPPASATFRPAALRSATVPLIGGVLDGPLHIGVWPLLYGFAMWLSHADEPAAGDRPDAEAHVPALPDRLHLASWRTSPAGLLIYWTWSIAPVDHAAVCDHAPLQDREPDRQLHRPASASAARRAGKPA